MADNTSRARIASLFVVSMATFMSALDGSIVNVVLPLVRADFRAPLESMDWIVSAYLLSISALLLPAGRLGDSFGFTRMLAVGFALFGGASLLCGVAPSVATLSLARMVQGVGAAMLMAAGPAQLSAAFPPEQRGRALGAQATVTYLGLALGPTVGGVLATNVGWRWVFWINLPIALCGAIFAWRMQRAARAARPTSLDWQGALLWTVFLCSTIFAIERTEAALALRAGLVSLAVVSLVAFVRRESTAESPMLPLQLFRNASFSGGVTAAWLHYGAVFLMTFLLTFYLQETLGWSAARTGLVMTAQPVAMALTTAAAGWLSDRVGPRVPATMGMLIVAFGMWLLSTLSVGVSEWAVVVRLVVVGFGVGVFTTPNNSSIFAAAPVQNRGVASGLLAAARNVGMVCGIAVAGAFLGGASHGNENPAVIEHAFHLGAHVSAVLSLVGAVLSVLRPAPQKDMRQATAPH